MMARFLINRLREPSTQAGIAALCVLVRLSTDQAQAVAELVGAAAGALAVFLPERPAA
jgi:hypothetical protein